MSQGSKKRSKIAIVAVMRRLGIQLWQIAKAAQCDGSLPPPVAKKTASARAQQKGAAPFRLAITSA
jgi:hypothetical protein